MHFVYALCGCMSRQSVKIVITICIHALRRRFAFLSYGGKVSGTYFVSCSYNKKNMTNQGSLPCLTIVHKTITGTMRWTAGACALM